MKREKQNRDQSPIARDQAARMSDEHWLHAMAKHAADHGQFREGAWRGGANQLGSELQQLTKLNPVRFVTLLAQIPVSTTPIYVDHILWGLAEAGNVDMALVREAVRLANARPGRHHEGAIVRLFERYPTAANNSAMLDLLLWIAENGATNDNPIYASSKEEEAITIEDLIFRASRLYMRGVNSVRGAAVEALESVVWKVPSTTDRIWTFVERRTATEPQISVRCCLVRPLTPLFNSDKPRCAKALEQIVEQAQPSHREKEIEDAALAALATQPATHLLQYIVRQVPDLGRRLLERLLNSPNETFRLVGSWHVLRASYSHATYVDRAEEIARIGPAQQRLAAALAADAAVHDEFRDRAERELTKYFDDEDSPTRSQAASVFRELREQDFREYRPLAEAYVASRAFDTEPLNFLHLLESGAGDVQDLVVASAERVLADLAQNGAAQGRRMSELHKLQDLIRRDYAATENDEQLRGRLLDVIDRMLAGDHYGSAAIVHDHDR